MDPVVGRADVKSPRAERVALATFHEGGDDVLLPASMAPSIEKPLASASVVASSVIVRRIGNFMQRILMRGA